MSHVKLTVVNPARPNLLRAQRLPAQDLTGIAGTGCRFFGARPVLPRPLARHVAAFQVCRRVEAGGEIFLLCAGAASPHAKTWPALMRQGCPRPSKSPRLRRSQAGRRGLRSGLRVDQRRAVEAIEAAHQGARRRRRRRGRPGEVPIGFGRTGERRAKVPRVVPSLAGLWRTRIAPRFRAASRALPGRPKASIPASAGDPGLEDLDTAGRTVDAALGAGKSSREVQGRGESGR